MRVSGDSVEKCESFFRRYVAANSTSHPLWLRVFETDVIENGAEAAAFGRGAHDANFNFHFWREVALADGGEVLAVEGAQCLNRVLFVNGLPPDRSGVREIEHGWTSRKNRG